MSGKATKDLKCTNLEQFKQWFNEVSKMEVAVGRVEAVVCNCQAEACGFAQAGGDEGEWEPVPSVGAKVAHEYKLDYPYTKSGNLETFNIEWEVVAFIDGQEQINHFEVIKKFSLKVYRIPLTVEHSRACTTMQPVLAKGEKLVERPIVDDHSIAKLNKIFDDGGPSLLLTKAAVVFNAQQNLYYYRSIEGVDIPPNAGQWFCGETGGIDFMAPTLEGVVEKYCEHRSKRTNAASL